MNTDAALRERAARAVVTPIVVASVPFFANSAQSACATKAVKNSASSTSTGAGPFITSPARAWAAAAASTSAS